MTTYRRALGGMVGNVTVEAVDGDQAVPVIHMSVSDKRFPLDLNKAAANMIDVLNGRQPSHRLDAGAHRIFYSRTDNAVMVRWQPEGEGNTLPGMVIVTSDKSSASAFGHSALERLNADAMKDFCSAVECTKGGKPSGGGPTNRNRPSPRNH